MNILIRNAKFIITMDSNRRILRKHSLYVEGDSIVEIGPIENMKYARKDDMVIDASDMIVIPGLVQTHVHMVQTMFRGLADDMSLLSWLKHRIWPLEAEISREGVYYSALLSAIELLKGGCTTVIDFGSVRFEEEIFKAMYEAGIRGASGKIVMDRGENVPEELLDNPDRALSRCEELLKKWHKRENRLYYILTPRFAVSCSDECLLKVAELAKKYGVRVQTHASENIDEVRIVKEKTGFYNIEYLHRLGLTGSNVILVHCIWITDEEMDILAKTGTHVVHCPSANLKLGSGIAKIPELLKLGVNVSLGADGAPCNNNLDIFIEMRIASLIHKARLLDPTVMPAPVTLEMATMRGAKALGLEDEIGSLEAGKKADITLISVRGIHLNPFTNYHDPISTLVYAGKSSDVKYVIVNGKLVVDNGRVLTVKEEHVLKKANEIAETLITKLGLNISGI